MSKIKDGNFITIQSFMVKDLALKGYELLIYAVIYGFSQDGKSWFQGSRQYIAEWSGASLSTVDRTLEKLQEKDLIKKNTREVNEVTLNAYKATPRQNEEGVVKMTTPPRQNDDTPLVKMTTNNIEKKDRDNIDTPPISPSQGDKRESRTRFTPPTEAEVQAYCNERDNGINAGEFCDFYASKGWLVGKTKMKDWKAAVRTWERARAKEQANNTNTSKSAYADDKGTPNGWTRLQWLEHKERIYTIQADEQHELDMLRLEA